MNEIYGKWNAVTPHFVIFHLYIRISLFFSSSSSERVKKLTFAQYNTLSYISYVWYIIINTHRRPFQICNIFSSFLSYVLDCVMRMDVFIGVWFILRSYARSEVKTCLFEMACIIECKFSSDVKNWNNFGAMSGIKVVEIGSKSLFDTICI